MDTTIAVIARNDDNESVANIQQMIFKSKIRNYRKIEVEKQIPDLNSAVFRVELMGCVCSNHRNFIIIINRRLLKIPGHADIELEHIYIKALIPS